MNPLPPFIAACLLAMPFFAAPSFAAGAAAPRTVDAEPEPAMPARLVGAQEYALTSPETGKTYRIQVSAIGEAPEEGYPVLYALDGEAVFPIVSLAARGMFMRAAEHQAAPLLIVGVGYFGEDRSVFRACFHTPSVFRHLPHGMRRLAPRRMLITTMWRERTDIITFPRLTRGISGTSKRPVRSSRPRSEAIEI